MLAVVVLFVNPKSVKIKEHFIGFVNICKTSGASLTEVVLEIFTVDFGGQEYDNGANMAGKNSGLQR